MKIKQFFIPKLGEQISLPFFSVKIAAGFPSPAEDHITDNIDLNKHLIKHPAATFFVQVSGHSMKDVGIYDGDILIVDRALDPKDGSIVVAIIDGEFTVKRIKLENQNIYLLPENSEFTPIKISPEMDFSIWGVVSTTIRKFV